MGQRSDDAVEEIALGGTGRGAVSKEEANLAGAGLSGEGNEGDSDHAQGGLLALADDQEIAGALFGEGNFGRPFDGVGSPKPDSRGPVSNRRFGRAPLPRSGRGWLNGSSCEERCEDFVLADVGGGVAFEHKWAR